MLDTGVRNHAAVDAATRANARSACLRPFSFFVLFLENGLKTGLTFCLLLLAIFVHQVSCSFQADYLFVEIYFAQGAEQLLIPIR